MPVYVDTCIEIQGLNNCKSLFQSRIDLALGAAG